MENIFSGLSLIIVIGAAVSLFMRYIHQPLMIGYILTGILVGPAVFGVLESPRSLSVFGDLGIALLLFIIGLGMNPKVVKEVGKPSIVTTIAQMVITGTVGWFVLVALGLSDRDAAFVAIGLTINSTIVALKLLSDKKEQSRLYGKLTIGASLAEDILAAILLLFVASADNGQWLTLGPLLSLAFKGVLIGTGMYVITRYLLPRAQKFIAGDQELLFLVAIGWGLGSAALLAKAGFSLEIGALAAGVFLAALPYAQEIAARLRPLRDFFIIVFFIALGTELTFNQFGEMLWPILAGTLIVVILKPLVILTALGLLGYTKRTSFKTALTLSQVSEFSIILVILATQRGLIEQQTVALLTFIALISIAISTYLVTFSDQLYTIFEKYLDMFERRKTQGEPLTRERNDLILFGYQKGGHEFVKVFKQMKKSYVVIDYDPEVIDILEHQRINHLYGDVTDLELLEEAGVSNAHLVVSTTNDYEISSFLLGYLEKNNPHAVSILQADSPKEAAKLYHLGASYVMLPHFIGSEQISGFVRRSRLHKDEFKRFREKHLKELEKQFGVLEEVAEEGQSKRLGQTIIKNMAKLTKAKS